MLPTIYFILQVLDLLRVEKGYQELSSMLIYLEYEPSNVSQVLYVSTSLARGYRSTTTNDTFGQVLTYILQEAIT